MKEVDELDPRCADYYGEINRHPRVDLEIAEIVECLEPAGVVVGDYLKRVDAVNETVPD